MAVKVALVGVGMLIGVVGGAALGIHAMDESGAGDVADASVLEAPDTDATPPTPEPAYGIWDRLAQCESTGNWHANTGNSYYGGVQQDMLFWRNYGGLAFAARPDLASRAEQITVAERGLAHQGWAAWPACSRKLGLR